VEELMEFFWGMVAGWFLAFLYMRKAYPEVAKADTYNEEETLERIRVALEEE
jgi:hypothetical protein